MGIGASAFLLAAGALFYWARHGQRRLLRRSPAARRPSGRRLRRVEAPTTRRLRRPASGWEIVATLVLLTAVVPARSRPPEPPPPPRARPWEQPLRRPPQGLRRPPGWIRRPRRLFRRPRPRLRRSRSQRSCSSRAMKGRAWSASRSGCRRCGSGVGPVGGVYGWLAEQAVCAFQKANGITVYGRVGAETHAALVDPTPLTPK